MEGFYREPSGKEVLRLDKEQASRCRVASPQTCDLRAKTQGEKQRAFDGGENTGGSGVIVENKWRVIFCSEVSVVCQYRLQKRGQKLQMGWVGKVLLF